MKPDSLSDSIWTSLGSPQLHGLSVGLVPAGLGLGLGLGVLLMDLSHRIRTKMRIRVIHRLGEGLGLRSGFRLGLVLR